MTGKKRVHKGRCKGNRTHDLCKCKGKYWKQKGTAGMEKGGERWGGADSQQNMNIIKMWWGNLLFCDEFGKC